MHFYDRGGGGTHGDSKAKISLRKHFRFLSRIMDCSRFDCIVINVGKKRVRAKHAPRTRLAGPESRG